MKRRLVELLRCPVSGASVNLHVLDEARVPAAVGPGAGCAVAEPEIREGFLHCSASGMAYPIIAGVPRMVRTAFEDYQDFYYRHRDSLGTLEHQGEVAQRLGKIDPRVFDHRSRDSFGLQWRKYQYEDKTWFKDDAELRRDEFLYNMQLTAEELQGKLLLDAGCGNGRLTASIASYGAEVVGLDFSPSVERAAAHALPLAGANAHLVHFVQGNILEPPFAPETFEHGHTSGVLHHTPDPIGALRRFVSLVQPGGRAYVQLYRQRPDWAGRLNQACRRVTTRVPVRVCWWLCNAAVPLHTAIVRLVALYRGEATAIHRASQRERAVSLFDNFSPPYQFRYTPDQVRKMFDEAGLHNVKDVTLANEARQMVAFVGTR